MYFTYLPRDNPFEAKRKAEERGVVMLPHLTDVFNVVLRSYHNMFTLCDLTIEYDSFDKLLCEHVFVVKTSRFGKEFLKEPQIILYFAEVDRDVG